MSPHCLISSLLYQEIEGEGELLPKFVLRGKLPNLAYSQNIKDETKEITVFLSLKR